MRGYFEITKARLNPNEQVVCILKINKTIDVSVICLSISCLTNNGEIKELKKRWKL